MWLAGAPMEIFLICIFCTELEFEVELDGESTVLATVGAIGVTFGALFARLGTCGSIGARAFSFLAVSEFLIWLM